MLNTFEVKVGQGLRDDIRAALRSNPDIFICGAGPADSSSTTWSFLVQVPVKMKARDLQDLVWSAPMCESIWCEVQQLTWYA